MQALRVSSWTTYVLPVLGAGGKSRREVNWSCCGLKMQAQLRMGSHVIGPARSLRIHKWQQGERFFCFASGFASLQALSGTVLIRHCDVAIPRTRRDLRIAMTASYTPSSDVLKTRNSGDLAAKQGRRR
jgi:hypothetical protein